MSVWQTSWSSCTVLADVFGTFVCHVPYSLLSNLLAFLLQHLGLYLPLCSWELFKPTSDLWWSNKGTTRSWHQVTLVCSDPLKTWPRHLNNRQLRLSEQTLSIRVKLLKRTFWGTKKHYLQWIRGKNFAFGKYFSDYLTGLTPQTCLISDVFARLLLPFFYSCLEYVEKLELLRWISDRPHALCATGI